MIADIARKKRGIDLARITAVVGTLVLAYVFKGRQQKHAATIFAPKKGRSKGVCNYQIYGSITKGTKKSQNYYD